MEPFARRCVELNRQTGESDMLRKIMTVAVLGASLAMAACNTVRGAAADVNSVANEVDRGT
jgi:predicted small secreted protein